MAGPVILAVDDEPQVLNAVGRDLRQHHGRDLSVIEAGSGQKALNAVKRLKRRGDQVALFLVDQRMPNMSGTEFLAKAREFYPQARKVLLKSAARRGVRGGSNYTVNTEILCSSRHDRPLTLEPR